MRGECDFSPLGNHETIVSIIYFSLSNESMILVNLNFLSFQMICIISISRNRPTPCVKAKIQPVFPQAETLIEATLINTQTSYTS